MSVVLTCPKCQASRKVKSELAGKRVRCPQCQAVIQIPDASDPAPVEEDPWDLPDSESAEEAPPVTRRPRRSKGPKALNPAQKALVLCLERPWLGFAALYLGVWFPLTLLIPKLGMGLNVFGVILCFFGVAGGLVVAMIGTTIRNPATVFTSLVLGGLASLALPAGMEATAGYIGGRAARGRTSKGLHELDTGTGGIVAVTIGGLAVLLLLHILILGLAHPELLLVQRV
jgi:predicted Zn finger-like uncharacterized protein